MTRPQLALCVLGLGCVAAFVLLLTGGFLSSSSGLQPAGRPEFDQSSSLSGGDVLRTARPTATLQPVERQQMEAVPSRHVQVVVLREGSRAPVAGAEVSICDYDSFLESCAQLDSRPNRAARGAILAELASRATTDADGRALLPFRGRRPMIDATDDSGLWGRRILWEQTEGPVEILVSLERTLRALVLSSVDGRPVAGVPVVLLSSALNSSTVGRDTSGLEGIATFNHLQRTRAEQADWQLSFGIPLRDPPVIPIQRDNLPPDPVPMILPATGSLEISIHDEHGRAVGGGQVELEVTAFETVERRRELPWGGSFRDPRVNQHGKASVPFLGLDFPLRITARPRESDSPHRTVQVDVNGPQHDGESVACEVLWPSDNSYPAVTGRFVRLDGRPWPEAEIDARPIIFPRLGSYILHQKIRVAADGRFRLVAREACPAGGSRIYILTCSAPDGLSGIKGRLDLSRPLPPGETDLGDVLLDYGDLLAAGTVVDQDGEPLPEARVRLSQLVQEGEQEFWPRYECAGGLGLSPDGSFALHAIPGQELPKSLLRLNVRCKGFPPVPDLDIALGQRDLRVVLVRGGALAGSIRLEPGQDASEIVLVLSNDEHKWFPRAKEDGSFGQDDLPAGTMQLVAYVSTESDAERTASRVTVEDLLIVSGETNRDPRTQGLSIHGGTTKLTVVVKDDLGVPIPRAAVETANFRYVLTDSHGVARLRPAELPVNLHVSAFGYREVRLTDVQNDLEVTLTTALQIRLVTDARPIGLDPDYHLGMFIYYVNARGNQGSIVYGGTLVHNRMKFDAEGQALLPVPGPGTYVVVPKVYVRNKDNVGRGGSLQLDPSPRITVLDTEELQTFHIDIPQHVLDATVQRYVR